MLFQGEHEYPFFYATDLNCPKQLIANSLNADKEISSTGVQLFCCMSAKEHLSWSLKLICLDLQIKDLVAAFTWQKRSDMLQTQPLILPSAIEQQRNAPPGW